MPLQDYEQENKYLPESLRVLVGKPNRIHKQSDKIFLRMFEGQILKAIKNNYYASELAAGYSIEVNSSNLMSGICPRLLDILVKKIASHIILEGENNLETLKQVISEDYLTRTIKEVYAASVRTGRGVIALDYIDNKISLRVFDLFRSDIKKDCYGNIKEAELFINMAAHEALEAYTVVEKRFYKKVKDELGNESVKAFQKFMVCKMSWKDDRKDETDKAYYEDAKYIPEGIKKNYKGIKFNVDIELPFDTLGIYPVDNTVYNTKFPYSNIPESQFVNIQDMVMELETARTYKEVDKNLGRGRAMLPEMMKAGMSKDSYGNTRYRVDTFFTPYKTLSMEDSKPQSVQFNLRSAEWREEIQGDIADICSAFGIGILDYQPTILGLGGNNHTDDEVNAITDITYATVTDKREIAAHSINAMLNDIATILKMTKPVTMRYNMSSIINPTKIDTLVRNQLASGLISRRTAIKRLNPDYSDAEIDEELARIKEETQAKQISDAFNEF